MKFIFLMLLFILVGVHFALERVVDSSPRDPQLLTMYVAMGIMLFVSNLILAFRRN